MDATHDTPAVDAAPAPVPVPVTFDGTPRTLVEKPADVDALEPRSFDVVLNPGDAGGYVQLAMMSLGLGDVLDYNEDAAAIVAELQEQAGLESHGIIDADTWPLVLPEVCLGERHPAVCVAKHLVGLKVNAVFDQALADAVGSDCIDVDTWGVLFDRTKAGRA